MKDESLIGCFVSMKNDNQVFLTLNHLQRSYLYLKQSNYSCCSLWFRSQHIWSVSRCVRQLLSKSRSGPSKFRSGPSVLAIGSRWNSNVTSKGMQIPVGTWARDLYWNFAIFRLRRRSIQPWVSSWKLYIIVLYFQNILNHLIWISVAQYIFKILRGAQSEIYSTDAQTSS